MDPGIPIANYLKQVTGQKINKSTVIRVEENNYTKTIEQKIKIKDNNNN